MYNESYIISQSPPAQYPFVAFFRGTGMGKRRRNINLSPCKQPQLSAICRLEQPARRGWRPRRMLCEEGVELKPEPIIPPCLLCPQTAWVSRGAHPAAMYSFVTLGGRDRWYTNPPISSTHPCLAIWSIRSHPFKGCTYCTYFCVYLPHFSSFYLPDSTSHGGCC